MVYRAAVFFVVQGISISIPAVGLKPKLSDNGIHPNHQILLTPPVHLPATAVKANHIYILRSLAYLQSLVLKCKRCPWPLHHPLNAFISHKYSSGLPSRHQHSPIIHTHSPKPTFKAPARLAFSPSTLQGQILKIKRRPSPCRTRNADPSSPPSSDRLPSQITSRPSLAAYLQSHIQV
jgi:hypothetical protein